ncbi:MAG: ribonuclease P protein component [Chthoniobacterales bacterium]
MDNTFPKSRRLTLSGEFRQVRERGVAQHSKLMVLSVLQPAPDVSLRIGFITSKRAGSAVERNQLRRRLREIFRLHQHQLAPNTWVVTIARHPAKLASYQRLESDWLQLARRASILCDS